MQKPAHFRAAATVALLGAWALAGCTETTTTRPALYRSTSGSKPDPISPLEKNYNNLNNKVEDVLFGPQ